MKTLVRPLVILALLLLCLATTAVLPWRSQKAPVRPNVILISIDTLRPDHLEPYGYKRRTSPFLQRFRGDAILFREVIAQAPSTLPSHASIFTSMLPQHHGASQNQNRPLADEAVTLAEVLHRNGYRTLAVVGGGQMAKVYGLTQGFETYEGDGKGALEVFAGIVLHGLRLLDQPDDRPFFLFLHTYQVHHPYTPEPWRLARLEPGYSGPLPGRIEVEMLLDINQRRRQIDARDLQHIVAAYDAEIGSMDHAFGFLIEALKARDLYRDTLIVFTSDHGEEFGEHGWVGWHSHTLYDELLRVPLIIKLPALRHAGAEVPAAVRSLDIAPTILAVAGVKPPSSFAGQDLLPFVRQGHRRGLGAVAWRETPTDEVMKFSGIRAGDWKLHGGRLYNLRLDPAEQRDLTAEKPEVVRTLERQLAGAIARRPPLRSGKARIDEETRESLKALGYVN
jgi:arylsulfatase A-like enzyme